MPGIPPQMNPLVVGEVNELIVSISPQLTRIVSLLKKNGANEFDITTGEGEVIRWSDGKRKLATHQDMVVSLTRILDSYYPDNHADFLGISWSNNQIIAHKLVEILEKKRELDRAQVESQLIEILAKFKSQ